MREVEQRMHLSEEALILYFYGEADEETSPERHLGSCEQCRAELDRLRRVLSLMDAEDVPHPAPDFEEKVWARLEPQLPRREPRSMSRLFAAPRWLYAGGLAALLVISFIAGRFTGGARTDTPATGAEAGSPTERVLMVAVLDHLDRSEMVLLKLMNADLGGPTLHLDGEQSRARELVGANRLYRQSATHAGDETLKDVLDELERVLLEIANTPGEVTRQDVEALRTRIAARGLLFRVRVVQSAMRLREQRPFIPGSTS